MGNPVCYFIKRRPVRETLGSLARRELEILVLEKVAIPESSRRIVDVSQTCSRTRVLTSNTLATILPRTRAYLTDRCRSMIGVEALRAQGISWGSESDKKLLQYSSDFLMDMAGNAFHTGCCVTMMLAMIVTLAVGYKRKAGVKVHTIRRIDLFLGSALIDGEDSDGDIDAVW
jgi:hypothetical protein